MGVGVEEHGVIIRFRRLRGRDKGNCPDRYGRTSTSGKQARLTGQPRG
jgi:hypothetical protein